jgi:hypothetical protein
MTDFKNDLTLNINIVAWLTVNEPKNKLIRRLIKVTGRYA